MPGIVPRDCPSHAKDHTTVGAARILAQKYTSFRMGAAYSTTHESDSGKNLLCCLECSKSEPPRLAFGIFSDQRYKNWSESVQSRNGPTKSHHQVVPQKPKNVLHHTDFSSSHLHTPEILSKSKAIQASSRRSALSFAGKVPQGWTAEEQEKLELAVAEVACRSKLRSPGHRAMQAVMAARTQGQRASSAYGARQYRICLHEQQVNSTRFGYVHTFL
jgi:hypothetical protein